MVPNMWMGPTLTDPEEAKFAPQIDVTLTPTLDGKRVLPMGGFGLGLTSNSPNKDLAWEFIKFYAAKENQRKEVELGAQPARMSALRDPVNVKLRRFFPVLADSLPYAIPRPVIPEFAQAEQILGLELGKLVMGEKTVKQALQDANEAIYKVMMQTGRIKR